MKCQSVNKNLQAVFVGKGQSLNLSEIFRNAVEDGKKLW